MPEQEKTIGKGNAVLFATVLHEPKYYWKFQAISCAITRTNDLQVE